MAAASFKKYPKMDYKPAIVNHVGRGKVGTFP